LAIRYISKGKGKNRKVIPFSNRKKGVSVRSVSLQPKAVLKINKEQIKLLNTGQSSTFSKALNTVVMRAKRAGIPIYDSNVNTDGKTKPYHMWITDMKSHKKVKRSDTMVLAKNFGQAVDDYITIWNKENRMNMDIGYPVVQGTGLHPIKNKAEDVFITEDSTKRKKREEDKTLNEMFEERGLNRPFFEEQQILQAQKNPKNIGRRGHEQLVRKYWNDKVHPMGSSSGTMIARKDLDPDGYKKAIRDL